MSVFLLNLFLRTFGILGYSIKITIFMLGLSNYPMEETVNDLLLPLLFLFDILITSYTQNNHNVGGNNQEAAHLPNLDGNNEGPVEQAIDNEEVHHDNIQPAQDNYHEPEEVKGISNDYEGY